MTLLSSPAASIHVTPDPGSALLAVLVGVGALGTASLLGLAFAAFVRRRSRPYLLVVVAFGALFGRSLVAVGSVFGMVSPADHHLFEHGLDVFLVACVVAAVYYARTVSKGVKPS